ncbi:MAG: 16S rRNA (uracil(1498)-N(3))-methyltransferase [Synechococcaceae cyanobacterium]|jgi:16S rRNA (uracil1498-N3)-methyltransferase
MAERRRLLIDPDRLAATVTLERHEAHYVSRVLRLRAGDLLDLVDGRGQLWTGRLDPDGALTLEQPPDQPLQRASPPALLIELAMAVPRQDADAAWRMACELGADRLQPLAAQRQAMGTRVAHQRWHSIIREACEQCERLWLPELAPLCNSDAWLAEHAADLRLFATTRRHLPPLESLLPHAVAPPRLQPYRICLAVGPEGGWCGNEETVAEAAGWLPVSLGDTILRTSTAAVAGLARLVAWRAHASLAHHRLGH